MKGKKIAIYKDDYDALISGLLVNGVDEKQADRLKKKLTVAKYKEEYLKNNNKLKKLVGTPEYTQAVEREFNKIADKFIKKDKVVKLN